MEYYLFFVKINKKMPNTAIRLLFHLEMPILYTIAIHLYEMPGTAIHLLRNAYYGDLFILSP